MIRKTSLFSVNYFFFPVVLFVEVKYKSIKLALDGLESIIASYCLEISNVTSKVLSVFVVTEESRISHTALNSRNFLICPSFKQSLVCFISIFYLILSISNNLSFRDEKVAYVIWFMKGLLDFFLYYTSFN